jgi:hypothetical protein
MSNADGLRRAVRRISGGFILIVAAHLVLAASPQTKSLEMGLTWVVDQTTRLAKLTIAPGAYLMAPDGYSLTMTVNGVETGLRPGAYTGDILLNVTEVNAIKFSDTISHDFRQALYLDQSGIVAIKSVLPAAGKYSLSNEVLTGLRVRSTGENFNGIYVAGGSYTIRGASIDLTGNGGDDFAGYGAAVMSAGKDTRLVVDGARIRTRGVVRTAAVADKGSHLIVKNSDLKALGGTLPPDYIPNTALGLMKNVPWLLGVSGNNRATNLLGDNTTATYINSSIAAEDWGVLSVDASSNTRLTAINSKIQITGNSGYGTYAIGNSVNSFYGCDIRVPDYAAIIVGGHVIYGASTPAILSRLNGELNLGLSPDELRSLRQRPTTVHSGRFGLMIWGDATVKISDDTTFDTAQSTFLIKRAAASIDVDGSNGARLNPGNGIIVQVMETDNPGPVVLNGRRLTIGVYHEPKFPAIRASDFDLTASHSTDVIANLHKINLSGSFYNAARGAVPVPAAAAAGASSPAPGAATIVAPPVGRNLVLNVEDSSVTGVISASVSRHSVDTITAQQYRQLGEVTNTPEPAINNGVIVTLRSSTWAVTGKSYLTSLSIDGGSKIEAANGYQLVMTVDGRAAQPTPGTYQGLIMMDLSRITH